MRCWLAIWLLFTPLAGRAQDALGEPPKVGQPADFSNLVGVFQLKVEATPIAVAVEAPLTLTVTILGQPAAGHAPKRAGLRIFPAGFERDFFVEPLADEVKEGAWRFTYRLRPKHEQVKHVPSFKLVYYAPWQRRYQSAYSDALPLTVGPRRVPNIAVEGLKVVQAPPSFFELADGTWESGEQPGALPVWAAIIIVLAPPLGCALGVRWWRRRLAMEGRVRRTRRRALEQVESALASAGDAWTTMGLLAEFLRVRLGFPAQEPTPIEVERWLKRRGVSRSLGREWRQLLEAAETARFAPRAAGDVAELNHRAVALIHALEAAPCLAD